MVVMTRANTSLTASNVEVVMGMTSKTPAFSGNHGDDWEMKFSAHLMEKRLDTCLDPNFETRLPNKESGPFNMAVEDKKNQKEAVDMNKKTMCQFIQAFVTMSLLSKVNLQKKDKLFPSGRVWKLWVELQVYFNPDNSIAETELELALSKLKLANKKNPRKLRKEIALCADNYGVPVNDQKKIAQLICLGGKKMAL
jgi:hypothetical protein